MATLFETPFQLFPLRPRQEAAINAIRQAVREGHKRIILQAPCGSGKTIISSHIIAYALDKGRRPLFCVPRLSLILQTIKKLEAQGIRDIGVIQGEHERTDPFARVQIASVQTLVRRPLPEIDFVILDEVHLCFSALDKILDSEAWANTIVIGLSATPWRKGMARRWTKLVPFATPNELIAEGWLTPVIGYGVPEEFLPDRSKLHENFDGDYVESEAEAAMMTPPIVGNVIATWKKYGPDGLGLHTGDRTFMFCVNRSHAKKMQEKFESAGVPCGYIDGTMNAEVRERIFERYRNREIKILSSIDTIGVGVDEDVRCIIYLRLTKSDLKYCQDCGRGLRLADGKKHLTLLDHSGTSENLGLFTNIYYDTLDARDPEQKGPAYPDDPGPEKPLQCFACNALVPRGSETCPFCHAPMPKPKPKLPRHVDGELVLISGNGKKKPKKPEYTMEEKQEWYSGLLYLARQRGKSDGLAAHRYRLKFGVWPNQLYKDAYPPSPEVIKFDRHCRIAWAKSQQNGGQRHDRRRTSVFAPCSENRQREVDCALSGTRRPSCLTLNRRGKEGSRRDPVHEPGLRHESDPGRSGAALERPVFRLEDSPSGAGSTLSERPAGIPGAPARAGRHPPRHRWPSEILGGGGKAYTK